MANIRSFYHNHSFEDANIWQNLKQAIVNSSGFKRWQYEQSPEKIQGISLDQLVSSYLRETLEALAY